MSEGLSGLDQIPSSMRQPLQAYVSTIMEFAGSQCLTVTVFGSIAAGTFDSTKHTVRNVAVLQAVELDVLRRLAKEGVKLGKARIAAPLIMTPEYIQGSLDSFPLEFLEIQQRHVCLFGPDYFEPLEFEDRHVRLQCERELKTILIGMRQGLLGAAGREKMLSGIEADVVERLIRTMRGLLWLRARRDPLPATQVLNEVEQSVNQSLPGLRKALTEQGQHEWDEFRNLYADVDTLRKFIDVW